MKFMYKNKKYFKILLISLTLMASFCHKPVEAPKLLKEADVIKEMKVTVGRSISGRIGDLETMKTLAQMGEVIMVDETIEELPWLISAGVLIDAPVEDVWQVITEFEHWPDFMPFVSSTEVMERGRNIVEVKWNVGIWVLAFPLFMEYNLKYLHRPPFRTDWILTEGDMEANCGFWELIPVEEGRKTLAFYSLSSEPKLWYMSLFAKKDPILKKAFSIWFPIVIVKSIKERVESLREQKEIVEPTPEIELIYPMWEWLPLKSLLALSARGPLMIVEEKIKERPQFTTVYRAMNASPSEVWPDIVDFEKLPNIVTLVKDAKVIEKKEASATVNLDINIPYIFLTKKFSLTLEEHFYKPEMVSWNLIEGDMKEFKGSWELLPLDNMSIAFLRQHWDVRSLGLPMRLIIKQHPIFESAILATISLTWIKSFNDWFERREENDSFSK